VADLKLSSEKFPMKIKPLRLIGLAVALLVVNSVALHAAEASKEDAGMVSKLIGALEKSDYEAFVADGEMPFKQVKKEQFEAVAAKVGPKLQGGHDLTYLGELKQRGYHVTLWRVSFADGSDDLLATLSMKDGKVGGFFIR
jgi:hypothetical protein